MRRMECKSCLCIVLFEIVDDPENIVANGDPEDMFYCPVCSSTEPSAEIPFTASPREAPQEGGV